MAALTIRRLPPVHSPLRASDLAAAAVRAFRRDPGSIYEDLEALLTRRFEATDALVCGSGTQALELALRIAMSAGSTGAVAIPGYGCFDLVTAAVGADASIVPYDLDPHTLSPDLDSLGAALARGVDAVIVTPLYGLPVDWDAVRSQIDAAGVVAVEDAAQSAGGRWRGRPVGALGDLSVFSFGRGKGWTGGGGGALLARGTFSGALTEPRAAIPSSGWGATSLLGSIGQWALGRPVLYGIPSKIPWLGLGETQYHEPVPLERASTVSAALASATAEVSEAERHTRTDRAGRLEAALDSLPSRVSRVQVVEGASPGYLRLPVTLPGRSSALRVHGTAVALGVGPAYPRVLSELASARERLVGPPPPLHGARDLVQRLVTLPTHRWVDGRVISAIVVEIDEMAR